MKIDALTACRCSDDCDVARVAAKRCNVIAHPDERRALIEQAIVSRRPVGRILQRQCAVGEKPEGTQAVVGSDHDRISFLSESLAVGGGKIGRRSLEISGVKPDDDGRLRGPWWCPDIEHQTVFAPCGLTGRGRIDQRAVRRCDRGGQYGGNPRCLRLRRLPPQVSNRRRRIRNSKVGAAGASQDASDHAAWRGDDARIVRGLGFYAERSVDWKQKENDRNEADGTRDSVRHTSPRR